MKPVDYESAPERISSISAFGTYGERKDPMIYDSEIFLSDILYERKVDYKKASIIQYLTDNLYWAITADSDSEDIQEIPISSLKTFKLGVYTAVGNYTDPADSEVLPTYGTPTYVTECTRGKPGGITSEKDILYPYLLNGTQIDLTRYYV